MEEKIFKDKNFLLGLVSGIAAISLVGFIWLAVTATAQPKSVTNNNGSVVSGQENNGPVDLKVTDSDRIYGNKKAAVTILEWSDFQCPYCARFHEAVKKIVDESNGKVRWVFRHFPLPPTSHPYAQAAAEAAECANEQGKFWEYGDKLFTNQSSLQAQGESYLKAAAQEVGLNMDKFNSCFSSNKYASVIDAQYQAGVEIGVKGTPGSYLNGVELGGAVPYEQLKAQVDALLK